MLSFVLTLYILQVVDMVVIGV